MPSFVEFTLPEVRKVRDGYIGGFLFIDGVTKVPTQYTGKAEKLLCQYYGCIMSGSEHVSAPKKAAKTVSKRRTTRARAQRDPTVVPRRTTVTPDGTDG